MMNGSKGWKGVFLLGLVPFFLPVCVGLYRMSIESWTLFDFIVLYSFLYWPTYVIGLILIVLSAVQLRKSRREREENAQGKR